MFFYFVCPQKGCEGALRITSATRVWQVGMKLCKTKKKADVLLGKALCNELVAEWREAEAERRRREELKAAKLQQQLALEEAGRSRCLRDRKKVLEVSCLWAVRRAFSAIFSRCKFTVWLVLHGLFASIRCCKVGVSHQCGSVPQNFEVTQVKSSLADPSLLSRFTTKCRLYMYSAGFSTRPLPLCAGELQVPAGDRLLAQGGIEGQSPEPQRPRAGRHCQLRCPFSHRRRRRVHRRHRVPARARSSSRSHIIRSISDHSGG